ncbi:uncharacterized protein N7479_005769 [Penicillium vulpinum]|uniref:uncharacterized protein n=1 Tax=Penicillium vulpinum TaxID=29845 RepID=UPI00254793E9|nr:uncharacterized protein N7479_005769 [Penicillium vulpinum]KAJ5958619.1 hypothetical protein N7479_005769 [Penicillium vulpinum]
MDIQRQFSSVHWIWGGGISFVYEVDPRIVVKVPKSGEFEREQFNKELEIYRIFSQNIPCPFIVQCFLISGNGIFLEIQGNHIRDEKTMAVTKGKNLEPLPLRKEWINYLAQAVAFLESLNLAHGDLRPENILLDRNRLKLSDFDCTAKIGAQRGTSGFLGSRTEQFALGSLYYLINYGFEVYGDRCLTEDPYEHGPKVTLSNEITEVEQSNGIGSGEGGSHEVRKSIETISSVRWPISIGRVIHRLWCGLADWWTLVPHSTNAEEKIAEQANGDSCDDVYQNRLEEDFLSKKEYCQDLEKRGLLDLLSSG